MTTAPTITRAALRRRARAFRIAHAAWAVVGLVSLGYIWICAALRRRDRLVAAAVAVLSVEGVALVVGDGNCPFGPLQQRLGDPVPLFELVLPREQRRPRFPCYSRLLSRASSPSPHVNLAVDEAGIRAELSSPSLRRVRRAEGEAD